MKRIIALLLVLLLAFALVGCGTTTSDDTNETTETSDDMKTNTDAAKEDTMIVGVSSMNSVEPFYRIMQDGMEAKADELGIKLDVVSADGDIAKQTGQIEDFITNKLDAIVAIPCDGEGIVTAIEAANTAGIPIFTADIGAPNADVASYIASDSYAGGKAIGEWLIEHLAGEEGNVIIMNDSKLDSVYLRADGFKDAVAGSNINIIEEANVGYQRDVAMKAVEDYLIAYPDLNVVFTAQGTDVALAANDAVAAAGKTGDVIVCSFDGFEETVNALRSGTSAIEVDAFNDAYAVGEITIETVADMLAGKKVEKLIKIPVPLITKENVDAFYEEHYS